MEKLAEIDKNENVSCKRIPYDAIYKQAFGNKYAVESLLRDFVPVQYVKDIDFSTLERLPSNFIADDFYNSHSDVIWKFKLDNGDVFYLPLFFELQDEIDHCMSVKILTYTGFMLQHIIESEKLIKGENLPHILPIVIYNGEYAWNAPLKINELFCPEFGNSGAYNTKNRYFVVDVKQYPKEILERNNGICAQLLKAENLYKFDNVSDIITSICETLKYEKYKDVYDAITALLNGLLINYGIIDSNTKITDLFDAKDMLCELAVRWKKERIDKEIFKRELKQLKIDLIKYLTIRFANVQNSIISNIELCGDKEQLEEILCFTYGSDSLQAIIDKIDKTLGK